MILLFLCSVVIAYIISLQCLFLVKCSCTKGCFIHGCMFKCLTGKCLFCLSSYMLISFYLVLIQRLYLFLLPRLLIIVN